MGLQQDLDAIAARQGKSIAPGNVIQGDGGGWPDAALPGERFAASHSIDDDGDAEEFADARDSAVPDSPMIPRPDKIQRPPAVVTRGDAIFQANQEAPENPPNFRTPDLTILGNDDAAYIAAYQGRQVELSGWEQAQVRKVVLTAIKRTIMSQLNEVDALLPKRKRNKPAEPKKRGRPKKVAE
jgi:hypothetical protein